MPSASLSSLDQGGESRGNGRRILAEVVEMIGHEDTMVTKILPLLIWIGVEEGECLHPSVSVVEEVDVVATSFLPTAFTCFLFCESLIPKVIVEIERLCNLHGVNQRVA